MKKINIALLPGDGIGREVMQAVMPLLQENNLPIDIKLGEIGWSCWQKYGDPIPTETWALIHKSDAVLLGATTSKPDKEAYAELENHLQNRALQYISPIVQLRQKLDLYANVRPCFSINKTKPFRFTVIRENTEGLYAGLDYYPLPEQLLAFIHQHPKWQNLTAENSACSLRLQTADGLKRIFQYAFDYAIREKMTKVTFADKPNVLRKSSGFAREIFEMVAADYPNIKAEIHNVDAVALWLVRKPESFGVIVAENMFGDILSDLGAGVMGGLGFAASANIGKHGCYFEPVHGSGPNMQKNTANPSAMFLTVALLFQHFGYIKIAEAIQQSVRQTIALGAYLTYDLGGKSSTNAMASAIHSQFKLNYAGLVCKN